MLKYNNAKKLDFHHRILMIGFGSIGQTLLPLIFHHLNIQPSQITIISKIDDNPELIQQFGVHFQVVNITKNNYQSVIEQYLQQDDILLNMSVDISSIDLIKLCQLKQILYLDLCTEPWHGWYTDSSLPPEQRSNYVLREEVIQLKGQGRPTSVLTHGANPGLVSHFVKQALINIAKENELDFKVPTTPVEWANLAKVLDIKVIHIAEHDTQAIHSAKENNEFINTWSVDGFLSEAAQPTELGWGTHERHWPDDAHGYEFGSKCSIFLRRPGASTRVRSWSPSHGSFHGFLISHAEAISIAHYLTLQDQNQPHYRPTVHYAYLPCDHAVLSLHEFAGNEWQPQEKKRLIFDEIVSGTDELGVLLMGNQKGVYWYGSTLSIEEARKIIPFTNATSLQVAAGAIAGMLWAIEHPESGVVEPEEMDYQYILEIAAPYLGKMQGCFTDWTPIQNRARLFKENIDLSDPWQFINIRVN